MGVEGLGVELGDFRLRGVDLELAEGEYHVLLGPTGSGKTVLLETILGLHQPTTGRVLLGGEDAGGRPLEERGLGYVPQDLALFPNLDVAENLAFGLRVRRWAEACIRERVGELLELLGIEHLERRSVVHLSGGEKQRVAMGRALAPRPRLVLLDEPLSALDENHRVELAAGLRQIQQRVRGTFLHVCHNLDEAAQVADRITLLRGGRVVQTGSPSDLLERPRTAFVARFTGAGNLFPLEREPTRGGPREGGDPEEAPSGRVRTATGTLLGTAHPRARATHVAVRAEEVCLLPPGSDSPPGGGGPEEENLLRGRVVERTRRAAGWEFRVSLDRECWLVRLPRTEGGGIPECGDEVRLRVPPGAVWTLEDGAPLQ